MGSRLGFWIWFGIGLFPWYVFAIGGPAGNTCYNVVQEYLDWFWDTSKKSANERAQSNKNSAPPTIYHQLITKETLLRGESTALGLPSSFFLSKDYLKIIIGSGAYEFPALTPVSGGISGDEKIVSLYHEQLLPAMAAIRGVQSAEIEKVSYYGESILDSNNLYGTFFFFIEQPIEQPFLEIRDAVPVGTLWWVKLGPNGKILQQDYVQLTIDNRTPPIKLRQLMYGIGFNSF